MYRKQTLVLFLTLCLATLSPAWADKVIAVVKKEKIIKTRGYGEASRELSVAAKPETAYPLPLRVTPYGFGWDVGNQSGHRLTDSGNVNPRLFLAGIAAVYLRDLAPK